MFRSLILMSIFALNTSYAGGVVPSGELKDTISAKFVKNVNDPITQIAQTIARINQESIDVLNPNGIISMPVKGTDMHLVTLNSELHSNPWINAVRNGDKCSTTNQETKFLILLYTRTKTFVGTREDKLVLTAKARVQLTRKILNNSTQSCNDDIGVYSETQTMIDTDRCQLAAISEL